MKPKMMSRQSLEYLFHHILDGFKTSHEGIAQLQQKHLVSDEEIHALIRKNSERLIERIHEFKLHEKIFGIVFALLFSWLQVTGDELDMRRTNVRVRTTRAARAARGRRARDND